MANGVLLQLEGVTKHFPVRSGFLRRRTASVHAVDGVSLTLHEHETLGLVGESGCGKTTLGRIIIRLEEPTSGSVRFAGSEVSRLKGRHLRSFRRRVQMVFQDPYSSLNPRLTVGATMDAPLRIHGICKTRRKRRDRAADLLERVGLKCWALDRYPHEFSGGQRQRIAIARSLATQPDLIIADEAVSALDVCIRAQILNLMKELGREIGMACIFISHDLAVVRHMAERVAVMYLGRVVEAGPREAVYASPRHPYTRALIAAVPVPGRRALNRTVLAGDVPNPMNPPSGCRFHPRCPFAEERCRREGPELRPVGTVGRPHAVACHLDICRIPFDAPRLP